MILAGIDPSYQRTGIAIYKDGVIYIKNCKTLPNKDKSFQTVWNEAREQVSRIKDALTKVGTECVVKYDGILSECPPPSGQYSPGLYALDSLMFERLIHMTSELRVVYPNYLGHVHGKRGYTKTESVELARVMLDRLQDSVTVETQSKRVSHDESEAVIFLCRLFVYKNMFLDELKEFKGLFSEKDKKLI